MILDTDQKNKNNESFTKLYNVTLKNFLAENTRFFEYYVNYVRILALTLGEII